MTDGKVLRPVALSIAGTDSGAGSGIAVDMLAMGALGVHGVFAVTAVTAQSSAVVKGIWPVDPRALEAQLEAVNRDFHIAAAKTGMLAEASLVEVVCRFFESHALPLVVDPVLISTSGTRLLSQPAFQLMKERLLPHATLVTPNLPELEALAGHAIGCEQEVLRAASFLSNELGAAVLVKGGHREGPPTDILVIEGQVVRVLEYDRIDTRLTRGTGCLLSATITAYLARGEALIIAVEKARSDLQTCLKRSQDVFRESVGIGPSDPLAGLAISE
jgi:hydroxymethylpyrimidine kinase/phosphomethylpyrimidine kinase